METDELGCLQSWGWGAEALEASTGSRLAEHLGLVELAASFLHTHHRVSGQALQVAWTTPKPSPLGNLPVRGPKRKEGRKVLFSVSQAQPDSTNPVTFFCPSGIWAKGNFVGVGYGLRDCCVHWLQTRDTRMGSLMLSQQPLVGWSRSRRSLSQGQGVWEDLQADRTGPCLSSSPLSPASADLSPCKAKMIQRFFKLKE